METRPIEIVKFTNAEHRDRVIDIWREIFGYEDAHNDPGLVIDKKIEVNDGLFFVARADTNIIGTIMAGYDGHRGWIYSLAVLPQYQKKSLGSALLTYAEKKLLALGCVKINLQIVDGNDSAVKFYETNGYTIEKRISMGKRLGEDI